jgi:tRNA (guanine37-N1)-methyltransferase
VIESLFVQIDILTLFPQMFDCILSGGIFKRAIDPGLASFNIINFREYAHDVHHIVDDYVYGGGPGMVLKPGPLFEAVEAITKSEKNIDKTIPVVLMTPQGKPFVQEKAFELAKNEHIIIICGHYEGIDERIRKHLVTDEISIGDYVLSGGEVAAMVVAEAIIRLLPGVLGSAESLLEDSHISGLLEYPQYTRPPLFRDWQIPDILLSGNHAEIAKWRREQSIIRTWQRRPDLLEKARLTKKDKELIESLNKS